MDNVPDDFYSMGEKVLGFLIFVLCFSGFILFLVWVTPLDKETLQLEKDHRAFMASTRKIWDNPEMQELAHIGNKMYWKRMNEENARREKEWQEWIDGKEERAKVKLDATFKKVESFNKTIGGITNQIKDLTKKGTGLGDQMTDKVEGE